jgi:hypothetical protein
LSGTIERRKVELCHVIWTRTRTWKENETGEAAQFNYQGSGAVPEKSKMIFSVSPMDAYKSKEKNGFYCS